MAWSPTWEYLSFRRAPAAKGWPRTAQGVRPGGDDRFGPRPVRAAEPRAAGSAADSPDPADAAAGLPYPWSRTYVRTGVAVKLQNLDQTLAAPPRPGHRGRPQAAPMWRREARSDAELARHMQKSDDSAARYRDHATRVGRLAITRSDAGEPWHSITNMCSNGKASQSVRQYVLINSMSQATLSARMGTDGASLDGQAVRSSALRRAPRSADPGRDRARRRAARRRVRSPLTARAPC